MKIIVTRRSHDYLACLEGHPEIWEYGVTPDEAIGKLVSARAEIFKIQVVFA